jgi:hypothetical protein
MFSTAREPAFIKDQAGSKDSSPRQYYRVYKCKKCKVSRTILSLIRLAYRELGKEKVALIAEECGTDVSLLPKYEDEEGDRTESRASLTVQTQARNARPSIQNHYKPPRHRKEARTDSSGCRRPKTASWIVSERSYIR